MAFDQTPMLSLFPGLVRIAVLVLAFCGSSAIFSKLPIRLRVITVYLLKTGKAQKTEDRIAPHPAAQARVPAGRHDSKGEYGLSQGQEGR